MQDNQPNQQYISNSLLNQLAQKAMEVAEREAIISQLYEEIEKLKGKGADK